MSDFTFYDITVIFVLIVNIYIKHIKNHSYKMALPEKTDTNKSLERDPVCRSHYAKEFKEVGTFPAWLLCKLNYNHII